MDSRVVATEGRGSFQACQPTDLAVAARVLCSWRMLAVLPVAPGIRARGEVRTPVRIERLSLPLGPSPHTSGALQERQVDVAIGLAPHESIEDVGVATAMRCLHGCAGCRRWSSHVQPAVVTK